MQKQRLLRKILFIIMPTVFFIGIITSCKKQNEYPIEPHIEYLSFTKIPNSGTADNKAFLAITFTDGDGDIGLEKDDTLPPFNPGSEYYYNYYIDYYEKLNDTFRRIDLPFPFNARIPYVEESLAERGIKGEIQIEIYINNVNSTADSIRFDLQIVDRAQHKSNIVTTPAFYIKKK